MKIIACDYDGTLFQEDGTGVSQDDKDAIIKFRSYGGKFGIVTGRDMIASQKVLKSLPNLLDFLICSTGAIICDGCGNIVSQSKSNNTKSICQIAEFSSKNNVSHFTIINESTRYCLDTSSPNIKELSSIKEFNNCTIWFETIKDAEAVEEYIKHNHSENFTFFRNFECIEITPPNVTKASAVKKFISEFNSPIVYAVGDGTTDIPMIKEFHGFAVENANPKAKEAAKYHCHRVCDMIESIFHM